MNSDDKNKKGRLGGTYITLGTSLGLCLGVAVGVATDNLAIGIGVGLALGVGIGAALDARNAKKKDEETREGPPEQ